VKTKPPTLTAGEIAAILGADVIGDATRMVSGAEVVDRADDTQLSFIGNANHRKRLGKSRSQLIIVPQDLAAELSADPDRTLIPVEQPEAAFLTILAVLIPQRSRPNTGIAGSAIVAPSASIGANTNIHPLAVVGDDVTIGRNCDIHSGVVIGHGCTIGDAVVIHANTVLYHDVIIEDHAVIHATCVIGADGFGYRVVDGKHTRLPHFGNVRICNDVEIGAGTTIDRAKVGETVIGRGTKLDNQVMIGHNCQVGEHNLMAAQVGFAGSVTTGNYVICAGQAGIADHVHLHDGSIVGAKTGVHRDVPAGESYLGNPASPSRQAARQTMSLRRLPAMRDSIRDLKKEVVRLQQQLASMQAKTTSLDDRAAA
jgi:UDP-3-O-[3-hydroxymyristoyl] glucosamine N-acyltransferase